MTDPNNPNSTAIQKAVGGLGDVIKYKARAEFGETIMRRSARFDRSMGLQKDRVMAALDKVKAGGKSVGGLVEELEKASTNPQEYNKKMAELVALAGDANASEIAEIAQGLQEFSGGEHIVAALRGGVAVGERMAALTGKNREARATAASDLMGDALGGKRISLQQMNRLMGKSEAAAKTAMEEIVAKAPEEKRERAHYE